MMKVLQGSCNDHNLVITFVGHMHLRGCYHFFRKPRTDYEKWLEGHEKRKKKRLEEEEQLRQCEMDALSKLCSVALYRYQQQHALVHHQESGVMMTQYSMKNAYFSNVP